MVILYKFFYNICRISQNQLEFYFRFNSLGIVLYNKQRSFNGAKKYFTKSYELNMKTKYGKFSVNSIIFT